mgnify:FL=1|jgi:hypothetical protein
MKKTISVRANGKEYEIPNSWELLTSGQYLKLIELLSLMENGQYPPGAVKCLFLCYMMKWDLNKIKRDEKVLENFMSIASQITFIFQEKDDKLVLDLCFCRQQLPLIFIDKKAYYGYDINTDFQSLTCSLTALQYIEARQLLDMGEESLPLLAAVLYFGKGQYSSEKAQKLALQFRKLPANTLRAIALNFTAVNNFLFSKTEFSLLTKFLPQKGSSITTDATDALYDLSKDGLGNANQVEQMNVLTYLRILRKKTIEGVKSLKASGMEMAKIADEVGLPLEVVKQII